MIGTAGYVDPLYANTGQYSQHTDGYAMGVTLLTCLVGRPALEAMDRAESMLEEPTLLARQPPDQSCLDATAGWPQATSIALAQLVVGLSWRRSARSRGSCHAREPPTLPTRDQASRRRRGRLRGGQEASCACGRRAARYQCGHCACEACTLQLERCPPAASARSASWREVPRWPSRIPP